MSIKVAVVGAKGRMGQEDTGSRMTRIGKSELVHGEVLGFDEILGEISRVDSEQIRELAGERANRFLRRM